MRIKEGYYKVSDLFPINEEKAKNEFKPKFGDKAKRNSGENGKAVDAILKDVEAYDKPGRNKSKKEVDDGSNDYNGTTLSYNFNEGEPSQDYKDRVNAQVMGYPSVQNMNMHKGESNDEFDNDGNKTFYNNAKKNTEKRHKNKEIDTKTGLKSYRMDQAGKDYSGSSLFEGTPSKRLIFKNTKFLSEEHILAKVPEDYKRDGNKFYMRDKTGTDYIVECKADPFGVVHVNIEGKFNKQVINEELDKMRRLANYSYGDDNVKVDRSNVEDMSESIQNFRNILK